MPTVIDSKFKSYFMKVAKLAAENSYSRRAKVGAIIVRNGRIISTGWNGQPKGFDNCCEREIVLPSGERALETLPTVIHAEMNALFWCSKTEIISDNSELYVTLSPCVNCALGIIQCGIRKVYYLDEYRDTSGLELLRKCGIELEQVKI
jgi:dCMP deaminase